MFVALEYISMTIEFFLMFAKRYEIKIALLVALIIVMIIQFFDVKFRKNGV